MPNNLLSRERTLVAFSSVIVFFWIIFGIAMILSSFAHDVVNYPTAYAHPVAYPIMGASLIVGAVLIMLVNVEWKHLNTSWALERAGNLLALSSWLVYFFISITDDWHNSFDVILGVSMVVATVVRFTLVVAQERAIREKVRTLWKSGYFRP